ncbi:six-hairpin glycosidase [Microlunatus elymi]|uniref:Six-hairpin glycosidase n=1 Tax=Microlunatus elymi TaxID=2596828 RepID=A0A516PYA3_9ACTN|nr:six-hairpin glycosidase [Microlunatus elymi]QDP95951.1 six-hairpin glycosidase [Microlunatus elymi]
MIKSAVQIVFSNDRHAMNWLRADYSYAEVRFRRGHPADPRPRDLRAEVTTRQDGDLVRTEIVITNCGPKPEFTGVGDIGITLPLPDRYDDAITCQTQRCHAHLFCAGSASYVYARRMGGEAPHLGLVLTEGSLDNYSVERDFDRSSNDRGCFLLHPSPLVLQPGESTRIAWTIFGCRDTDDFFRRAGQYSRFVRTGWDRYVLFRGETARLRIEPAFEADVVTANGEQLIRDDDGCYRTEVVADSSGEHVVTVSADGRTVRTRILVKEPLELLLERRVAFIAGRQQYRGPRDRLDGALLIFDNEEDHLFYNRSGDFNAGRERVGMGILLAQYLTCVRDELIKVADPTVPPLVRSSLDAYADFVRRELIDAETGIVYDDVAPDRTHRRLYNAPWFASFFLQMYELDGRPGDVLTAAKIIDRYYQDGGERFYPIELPVLPLCRALGRIGDHDRLARATAAFTAHAQRIAQAGKGYPASEVNYEQSIVAPAADILLQVHALTGDAALLTAALEQLTVLEQFQGVQPDYHLNEVAIRHWDGFWFGKHGLYGDTFPHYWSGLTGTVFARYGFATDDPGYLRRAESALRAVLPLIFDDGRASCGYVYPYSVNGTRAEFYDPYANDQDWALVFALRHLRMLQAATVGA